MKPHQFAILVVLVAIVAFGAWYPTIEKAAHTRSRTEEKRIKTDAMAVLAVQEVRAFELVEGQDTRKEYAEQLSESAMRLRDFAVQATDKTAAQSLAACAEYCMKASEIVTNAPWDDAGEATARIELSALTAEFAKARDRL